MGFVKYICAELVQKKNRVHLKGRDPCHLTALPRLRVGIDGARYQGWVEKKNRKGRGLVKESEGWGA